MINYFEINQTNKHENKNNNKQTTPKTGKSL